MKRYVKENINLPVLQIAQDDTFNFMVNDILKYLQVHPRMGVREAIVDYLEYIQHLLADVEKEIVEKELMPYDEYKGLGASTEIYATDEEEVEEKEDKLPKGYYDDYFGQTAFEEYGDLVSKECGGKIISKRASEAEEPGGLIYEAEQLGIEDFYELLQCLEGMCYNGTAVEISDYQYKVL